jgi:hypothetical protein
MADLNNEEKRQFEGEAEGQQAEALERKGTSASPPQPQPQALTFWSRAILHSSALPRGQFTPHLDLETRYPCGALASVDNSYSWESWEGHAQKDGESARCQQRNVFEPGSGG